MAPADRQPTGVLFTSGLVFSMRLRHRSRSGIKTMYALQYTSNGFFLLCFVYFDNTIIHVSRSLILFEVAWVEMWGSYCTGWNLWTKLTGANTSPHGQNGRHFADDTFKCIFMNEKSSNVISVRISLTFVPEGANDNKLALVQVMAWHRRVNSCGTLYFVNEYLVGTKPFSVEFTQPYCTGDRTICYCDYEGWLSYESYETRRVSTDVTPLQCTVCSANFAQHKNVYRFKELRARYCWHKTWCDFRVIPSFTRKKQSSPVTVYDISHKTRMFTKYWDHCTGSYP